MRLWYLSRVQPVKAPASLRIRAVSPEPSLFAHIKYGNKGRVRPKIRHLAPLDGCTCAFEEWVFTTEDEKYYNLTSWLNFSFNILSLHAYYQACSCKCIFARLLWFVCISKPSMMYSNVSTLYLFIYLFTFYLLIYYLFIEFIIFNQEDRL